MNNISLLAESLQAPWIDASFPIIRIVLMCIMAVCSIGIIITVIMQNSADNQSSAIMGGRESYYSQNRWDNRDGRLKVWTITLASIIAVSILLFFISTIIDPLA